MVRSPAWMLVLTLLPVRAFAASPVPLVFVGNDVQVIDDPRPPLPHVGAALTAGAPSGIAGELVVRPWRAIRLHAGGAYDLASGGLLGGITIAPFRIAVAPVLEIETGHFFDGDASGLLGAALHLRGSASGPLQRVGYDFATAELGLELGGPDSFVFTVRAGLAAVQSTVHGLGAVVPSGAAITLADPQVRAVVPSARVGFVFFL